MNWPLSHKPNARVNFNNVVVILLDLDDGSTLSHGTMIKAIDNGQNKGRSSMKRFLMAIANLLL
jgi:hypothetical protein